MHTPFTNLTFCIRAFGCQMNKHYSERIAGMLEGMGALQVDAIEDADIMAFMTCCVRGRRHAAVRARWPRLKNVLARRHAACRSASSLWGGCISQRWRKRSTS